MRIELWPVPVTVPVYVPGVAPPALMDKVEVDDPPFDIVTLFGHSEITGLEGDTEDVSDTVPLYPRLDTVTVEVVDEPARVSKRLEGFAATLKSITLISLDALAL